MQQSEVFIYWFSGLQFLSDSSKEDGKWRRAIAAMTSDRLIPGLTVVTADSPNKFVARPRSGEPIVALDAVTVKGLYAAVDLVAQCGDMFHIVRTNVRRYLRDGLMRLRVHRQGQLPQRAAFADTQSPDLSLPSARKLQDATIDNDVHRIRYVASASLALDAVGSYRLERVRGSVCVR